MVDRSAVEVAVGLLARREHSVLELERKLQQRSFEQADIDQAVEKLQANNLLSEERFTESYINMRKHKGYGPLRIEQELRQRGVDAALIDPILDKESPEWRHIMAQQYHRKFGDRPAQDYAAKAKRARYLQNRGFPLDWVMNMGSIEDV